MTPHPRIRHAIHQHRGEAVNVLGDLMWYGGVKPLPFPSHMVPNATYVEVKIMYVNNWEDIAQGLLEQPLIMPKTSVPITKFHAKPILQVSQSFHNRVPSDGTLFRCGLENASPPKIPGGYHLHPELVTALENLPDQLP